MIFISHSSKDAALATALIDLLKAGLSGIVDSQIRCSSVDGYRLPVGVNTQDELRQEVNSAKVIVGLITPSSLSSSFVMFELGARWGAKLFLAPLLAGVAASKLPAPLGLLNALSANEDAQLHQLLADIAKQLKMETQSPASYSRHLSKVRVLAQAASEEGNTPAVRAAAAPAPKLEFKISVNVEGSPPSQVLKLAANRLIFVSRVEYMLSNEACIAAEDVSRDGETVEIPIDDKLLLQVWNTPRPDQSNYDHSGPAKIGITVAVDGKTTQCILPVQLKSLLLGSTFYREVVGSKTFRGIA